MQDKNSPAISKADSWKMFDDISPGYDFLNHILSFGLDIHWRNQLAHFLPKRHSLHVLDIATGTADVPISLLCHNKHVNSVTGIDLADKMLALGQQKIKRRYLNNRITLIHGDAQKLLMNDNSFDAATIAFGIRNMPDAGAVLKEMNRVINPKGRGIVLEFSLPQNEMFRSVHLFYLRKFVPCFGGLFSGNSSAYRYLNQTIETFPYGEAFCALMTQVGFVNVKAHPLMGGVATIYAGEKL